MKCPACAAANAEGARFCTSCGSALATANPNPGGESGLKPLDTDVEHVQREFAGGRGRISYRVARYALREEAPDQADCGLDQSHEPGQK